MKCFDIYQIKDTREQDLALAWQRGRHNDINVAYYFINYYMEYSKNCGYHTMYEIRETND